MRSMKCLNYNYSNYFLRGGETFVPFVLLVIMPLFSAVITTAKFCLVRAESPSTHTHVTEYCRDTLRDPCFT